MAEATTHADFAYSSHSARPAVPRPQSRNLHDDVPLLAASAGMASLGQDTQRIEDSPLYTHMDSPVMGVAQAALTYSDPPVADASETETALPSAHMDPGLSVHETAHFIPGLQLRTGTVETGPSRRSRGVNLACTNCRTIHKRCDDCHPCTTCIQRGVQDTCIRHARTTRPQRAGYTSYAPFGYPVAAPAIPGPGFSYPPSWPTGLASMSPYIQPSHGFSDVPNTFTAVGFGGAYPPVHGMAGHGLWQHIPMPAANGGVWNDRPPFISDPHQGFAGERPYDMNMNGTTMGAASHGVVPHLLSSLNNTSYNGDHTSFHDSNGFSQPLPNSSTNTVYNHDQYDSNGGEGLNGRFYGYNFQ